MLPSAFRLQRSLCCLSKPVGKGSISTESRSSSHCAQMFLLDQGQPSPSAHPCQCCEHLDFGTCLTGHEFTHCSQSFCL